MTIPRAGEDVDQLVGAWNSTAASEVAPAAPLEADRGTLSGPAVPLLGVDPAKLRAHVTKRRVQEGL